MMREGRKAFFSEEKKQKTFSPGAGLSRFAQRRTQKFFGSFFQKRTFLLLLLGASGHAWADAATTSTGGGIDASTGKAVYEHVCQGCHQKNAKGAMGAGAGFPALAGDQKLAVVGYPISMVENGHGGMPWFNGQLSDAQVAAVINYVRSHFGNDYKDTITAADVAASHGPAPVVER
jgi:mono/diheme cytochrome c family protein